jgi:Protein of unknown function (DUF2795)
MHRDSEQARNEFLRNEANGTIRGGSPESGRSRPSPGMSPADVARRAELSRHLPPGEFPADREGLLAHLRRKNAPASVIETISKLPEGPQFRSIGEVIRAIGTRTGHA